MTDNSGNDDVISSTKPVRRNEKIDFTFLREPETSWQKMKRKVKENPLVPIGMGLTTAALVLGLFNFSINNKRMQQVMMRARVVAQGGTVVALIGGLYLAATKDNAERRKKYAKD